MSCAMGLIALGVGYLVFLSASREKEGLKLLGQVIGITVMIAAVLSIVCASAKCMKKGDYSMGKGSCPMVSKAAPMCPLSAKGGDEPQQ